MTEILQAIMSLLVGLTYIVLAPYFLYALVWWFPLIFLTGLFTGHFFKKGSLDMLSPFIIFQMALPDNPKAARILGTITALLSFFGAYVFFGEGKFFSYMSVFIGLATIFGVLLSLKKKGGV